MPMVTWTLTWGDSDSGMITYDGGNGDDIAFCHCY